MGARVDEVKAVSNHSAGGLPVGTTVTIPTKRRGDSSAQSGIECVFLTMMMRVVHTACAQFLSRQRGDDPVMALRLPG